MQPARAGSLLSYLAQVPDPRGRKGRRHPLSAMLTAVVCGFLCGHRGWTGLAEWLNDQPLDVCHWMGFTRRPPKKDCFSDLMAKLDPAMLERAIRHWITGELELSDDDEALQAVSFDGKTLRGSLRDFAPAIHLLAAVDHQTGCVLSQMRVDKKTNEHKAALKMLKTLVWEGRVVVGDAIYCQRDLCEAIVSNGGDYFFAVKENQPTLLRDIEQEFAAAATAFSPWAGLQRAAEREESRDVDKGHGRLETRTLTSTTGLNRHLDWPHVGQVCRIVRERRTRGRYERETAYYVTSLMRDKANAARLLKLSRGHWAAIENGLHYVRDTTLDEDRCTIYRGHAAENLATLRNATLNWLRQTGAVNLASRIRSFTRNSQRLFAILGYLK